MLWALFDFLSKIDGFLMTMEYVPSIHELVSAHLKWASIVKTTYQNWPRFQRYFLSSSVDTIHSNPHITETRIWAPYNVIMCKCVDDWSGKPPPLTFWPSLGMYCSVSISPKIQLKIWKLNLSPEKENQFLSQTQFLLPCFNSCNKTTFVLEKRSKSTPSVYLLGKIIRGLCYMLQPKRLEHTFADCWTVNTVGLTVHFCGCGGVTCFEGVAEWISYYTVSWGRKAWPERCIKDLLVPKPVSVVIYLG